MMTYFRVFNTDLKATRSMNFILPHFMFRKFQQFVVARSIFVLYLAYRSHYVQYMYNVYNNNVCLKKYSVSLTVNDLFKSMNTEHFHTLTKNNN